MGGVEFVAEEVEVAEAEHKRNKTDKYTMNRGEERGWEKILRGICFIDL